MIRILLAALLLVGCEKEGYIKEMERSDKHKKDWSKAKVLKVERYIDESSYYHNKVSTFIMNNHKIIIDHGSYGGRMVAIPLNNNEEYIRMLEEENQLLGSKLAEYE